MVSSNINNTITKIKTTTHAHALETQQLDFKRFPTTANNENQKKKLSSLLREYTVAFANSDGGTLLLGIENNITCLKAITETTKKTLELNSLRYSYKDSPFKNDATKVDYDEYPKNKLPNTIGKVI